MKLCHHCSNTKRIGRCEFCNRIKATKPSAEDLRVDWPEIVNIENVRNEK